MGQTVLSGRATARTGPRSVVHVAVASTPRRYAVAKRTLDIALATAGLVIGLPLMALMAVLIRLDTPGPILFRQPRVARGGGVFTFYKFRTMYADARVRFPELYAYRYTRQEFVDMPLKTADDPRLTPLGAKLRRTSLDELPNLFNVLRGDMSLVGPRPELPDMVRYYTDEELSKFSVRPGVTGLWQVNGRANLRNGLQLANDVEYVKRRSLRLDIAILVKTVKAVVFRVGAL